MNKKELKKLSLKEERSIVGGEGLKPMLKAYGGPSVFPHKSENPQKNAMDAFIKSKEENLEHMQNFLHPSKNNNKNNWLFSVRWGNNILKKNF